MSILFDIFAGPFAPLAAGILAGLAFAALDATGWPKLNTKAARHRLVMAARLVAFVAIVLASDWSAGVAWWMAALITAGAWGITFRHVLNTLNGWPIDHIGTTKPYDRALRWMAAKLGPKPNPYAVANGLELLALVAGSVLAFVL